jgi:hypothetical protein
MGVDLIIRVMRTDYIRGSPFTRHLPSTVMTIVCGCVTNCVTITRITTDFGGSLRCLGRSTVENALVNAVRLLLRNAPRSTRVRLSLRRGHCAPRGGVKDLTAAVRSALPGRSLSTPGMGDR